MIRKLLCLVFFILPFASMAQEETDEEFAELPMQKKVFFGGNFGLQFGQLTFVDLSPAVGYRITKDLSAGVGASYRYFKLKTWDGGTNILGYRAFARYRILPNLFAYGEYEVLNGDWLGNQKPFNVESLLAGGGYRQTIGGRSSMFIMVLWNFSQSTYTPYANPVIRMGFNFGI